MSDADRIAHLERIIDLYRAIGTNVRETHALAADVVERMEQLNDEHASQAQQLVDAGLTSAKETLASVEAFARGVAVLKMLPATLARISEQFEMVEEQL